MASPTFTELLKTYSAAALGIMAFVGAIIGFWTGVTGPAAPIGLLVAASFVLLAYNVWLFRGSREADRGPAWRESRQAKLLRRILHGASALLLLTVWSITAMWLNDTAAVWLYSQIGYCKGIIDRIEPKLTGPEGLDSYQGWKLADCFSGRNELAQERKVLENLKTSRRALAELPVEQRSAYQGSIDAYIGINRLSASGGFDASSALGSLRNSARMFPNEPAAMAIYAYALAYSLPADTKPSPLVAEFDALISQLKKSMPQPGSNPSLEYHVHYWMGRSLLGAGRYLEAKSELEKSLEIAEAKLDVASQDRARSNLGKAEYMISSDVGTASKWWNKITTYESLADELNFQALSIETKLDEAERKNDDTKMQSLLKEMQDLSDQSARIGSDNARNQRLCDAIIDYYLKRYDDAVQLFKGIVESEPKVVSFRNWLAKSNFKAGKFADAEKEYATLVELNQDDHVSRYWLAESQYQQRHLADAEKTSRSALLVNSKDPALPLQLANILVQETAKDIDIGAKSRRLEEALGLAQSAKQLCGDEEKYRAALAATKSLRSNVLNRLAYTYAGAATDLALANGYIDDALEDSPDNPYFLDTKAYVLIARSRSPTDQDRRSALLSDAEALLKLALEKYAEDDRTARSETTGHLALMSSLAGRREDAIRNARRALELNPANEEARRLLRE
jgi:TolA-binding protein